jgi:hypothetical protein
LMTPTGILLDGIVRLTITLETLLVRDCPGFNDYEGLSLFEIAAFTNAKDVGLLLARRGAELTQRALKNGAYRPDFLRTIAHYYEYESEDNNHLSNALMCYLALKSRADIKRIDRKIFNDKSGRFYQEPTSRQTALHRAALFGFNRQYLTLLHLNTPTFLKDAQEKWPGEYLSEEQKENINQLTLHYQDLNLSTVDAIMSAISFTEPYNSNPVKIALENAYQLPAIKPLMDLAKFAALGQHRLSGRFSKAEVDTEYDSDDEPPIERKHRLSITLDPNSDNILYMHVSGKDGFDNIGTFGMCSGGRNRLYAGIKRPIADFIGTIIHEICHFVALEVFRNYEPYNTTVEKDKFQAIADELSKSKNELPEILQTPFNSECYGPANIHNELIVRVPQIILSRHMNGEDGIAELKARPDTKQLYDYYEQTFLPAVANHVEKLTTRAFHHWNPEVFKPKVI